MTSQTTLGIIIDDQTKAEEVAHQILDHFDKGKSSTSCAATYTPHCTFLTTLNQQCLDELVAMPPRYMHALFMHG